MEGLSFGKKQEEAHWRHSHVAQHRGQTGAEYPHAQALNEDTGEDDIEAHSAHRQDHRGHCVPLGLPHRLEGGKTKVKTSSKERT